MIKSGKLREVSDVRDSVDISSSRLLTFELKKDATHLEGGYFTSFVVVTGAEGIANLADDDTLFKNGAMALISKDGAVKYITNRWGIRYTTEKGWYLPSGNTTVAGGDWITDFKASELKSLVAEGDVLLLDFTCL